MSDNKIRSETQATFLGAQPGDFNKVQDFEIGTSGGSLLGHYV